MLVEVVEYSTDLHNRFFPDILSTTQTLGPWLWAQMQIPNALSCPTLKLTKDQMQRFNRQKGKPWSKVCSDLYPKSLLLWFPPPIAQQDDIFRGLCGLLVFSSVHTVNGFAFILPPWKGGISCENVHGQLCKVQTHLWCLLGLSKMFFCFF